MKSFIHLTIVAFLGCAWWVPTRAATVTFF